MKQAIKKTRKKSEKSNTKKSNKPTLQKKRKYVRKGKNKYGTSKLEQDFAKDFLDKLGVKYIYQFEAKDIGRFYDYYLPTSNLLIEIDGSYYHSDPRVVKEGEMSPMQKRNRSVDEIKNRWAALHCIPLMRIWEYDIRNDPNKVMKELKDRLYIEDKKIDLKENKKKRGRKKQNLEDDGKKKNG